LYKTFANIRLSATKNSKYKQSDLFNISVYNLQYNLLFNISLKQKEYVKIFRNVNLLFAGKFDKQKIKLLYNSFY